MLKPTDMRISRFSLRILTRDIGDLDRTIYALNPREQVERRCHHLRFAAPTARAGEALLRALDLCSAEEVVRFNGLTATSLASTALRIEAWIGIAHPSRMSEAMAWIRAIAPHADGPSEEETIVRPTIRVVC